MPKKTKQEKIIAELRRKLETTQSKEKMWEMGNKHSFSVNEKLDDEVRKNDNLKLEQKFTLPRIPHQYQTSNIPLPTSNLYIFKDLRKTFTLASLAIGFEIIAYFIWH